MKIAPKIVFALSLLILALVLGACNLPSRNATPTASGANALYTAAAQTVSAQLTQVAGPPATAMVTLVNPNQPQPTATLAPPTAFPTNTLLPATAGPTATSLPPSATAVPCDLARFVQDVTYPDNAAVQPGASFVKTWRLRNNGSCTWNTSYALVFAGGDRMSAPDAVALPQSVAPGGEIDLSVTLQAPSEAGTFRGDWKLRNASGTVFGLGDGTKPFFVQIKVNVKTGLLYDFLVQADSAEWVSGVGNSAGSALGFGGDENAPEGLATIKDVIKLETGAVSGKILLVFPRHETDGFVYGLYPAYKVQAGDRLRAKLGFMILTNTCHNGRVRFQITYREEGGSTTMLKEYIKNCNNSFTDVDIDLSGLKGKTVRFGFVVRAEGDFTDDWAVWNSPRIEQ